MANHPWALPNHGRGVFAGHSIARPDYDQLTFEQHAQSLLACGSVTGPFFSCRFIHNEVKERRSGFPSARYSEHLWQERTDRMEWVFLGGGEICASDYAPYISGEFGSLTLTVCPNRFRCQGLPAIRVFHRELAEGVAKAAAAFKHIRPHSSSLHKKRQWNGLAICARGCR